MRGEESLPLFPNRAETKEKRYEEGLRLDKKAKLRSVNKSLLSFRNLTGCGIRDGVLLLKNEILPGILKYSVKL